jgi:hypothetical protein
MDVILPDRTYKIYEQYLIKGNIKFDIYVANIEATISSETKTYQVTHLSPTLRFYSDTAQYGFFEADSNQLNNIVQICLKILSPTPKLPFVFFLEDNDEQDSEANTNRITNQTTEAINKPE